MAKKFLKIFVVLAVVIAAFYFSFNMVMTSLIHSKKEVITPNVIGKSLYDAIKELSKAGFGLNVDGEESNQDVPAGTILRQNPQPGMTVREGKVIKVAISCGREIIYVPNLVGQSIRSADITLRTSTLVMGEVSKRYSVMYAKDIIVAQDISTGSKVDKDSVVNLVVSDGQPPEGVILMPDLVNKSFQEATEWSLRFGIELNVTKEDSSEISASDIIVKQYPSADADITTGVKNVSIAVAIDSKNEYSEQ